jgi:hypothetical protein
MMRQHLELKYLAALRPACASRRLDAKRPLFETTPMESPIIEDF